jgi:hypothetical protein
MTDRHKHCNCRDWADNERHIPDPLEHGFKHCPYCGKALILGYTIKVYKCTNPEWEIESDHDNQKLFYEQETVLELEFATYKERNKHLEELGKQFSEPCSPTYKEIDHYLVMRGQITTTGGGAMGAALMGFGKYGVSEFKLWNGKGVEND